MRKGRLEAFSDGVLAIILTIMVLELKIPQAREISALLPLLPVFGSYVMSFVLVGIYWNNHHHLFQIVQQVNGRILWANSHLLFWLSLTPFVSGWMGETHFAPWPVALYGVVATGASLAYYVLVVALVAQHGKTSALARAMGNDRKGKISSALNILAIPLSFVFAPLAVALYVAVLLIWLVPDRRIESRLTDAGDPET